MAGEPGRGRRGTMGGKGGGGKRDVSWSRKMWQRASGGGRAEESAIGRSSLED